MFVIMREHQNSNDPRFVDYYAEQSMSEETAQRSTGIMNTVLRIRSENGDSVDDLLVADIGCNAGTQSRQWLNAGHRVSGIDISADLIELARTRNSDFAHKSAFEVGSATELPWESGRFDVCLMPELLEHVEDWHRCLSEGIRILKPGGSIFLSTTNVLCPFQNEFTLPLYSWYPAWLKRHYVRKALSDAPHLANFASYPAVHWFSPYSLKRALNAMNVDARDRFDMIDTTGRPALARAAVAMARALPPIRLLGHCMSVSTMLLGRKRR